MANPISMVLYFRHGRKYHASQGIIILDNDAVKRIKEIHNLPPDKKEKVLSVVDALIRDYKTKWVHQ